MTIAGGALPAPATAAPAPSPTTGLPAGSLPLLDRAADPLLWTGTYRNSAGAAVPGATLLLSARYGSAELRTAVPGAAATIDLGLVRTDANGEFAVRLPWRADLARLADRSGNVTFMLVSGSTTELAMVATTLKYVAALGGWGTAPQAKVVEERLSSNAAMVSNAATLPPLAGATMDVPSLAVTPPAGTRSTNRVDAASGQPYPGAPVACTLFASSDLPPVKTYIGHTAIQKAAGWEVEFDYANTSTTSSSVGVAAEGTGWAWGGATTVESTLGAFASVTTPGSADHQVGRKHWIRVSLYKYHWRCYHGSTTPVTTPGYWSSTYSVEKGPWYADFSADDFGDAAVPACTSVNGGPNDFELLPNARFGREDGTAQYIDNSFEVGIPEVGPAKFKGAVTVTNKNSVGNSVTNIYHNKLATGKKHLCGTANQSPVYGSGSVVATARTTL